MIRGSKTRMRALERDDLPHFVHWINDPETRRFMNIRYPISMVEEEKWWEGFLERKNDHIFAIETKDGTYIGNIGLHGIERENRRAQLGIVIGDKSFWGSSAIDSRCTSTIRVFGRIWNTNRPIFVVTLETAIDITR